MVRARCEAAASGQGVPDPIRGRWSAGVREGRRRTPSAGRAEEAFSAVRFEGASREDPRGAVRASVADVQDRQGARELRLLGVHALLAPNPKGIVGTGDEDT